MSESITKEGKVICQICQKPYSLISPSHLKTHKITMDQYRMRFPDAIVASKDFKLKQKFSQISPFRAKQIAAEEEKIRERVSDESTEVDEIAYEEKNLPKIENLSVEEDKDLSREIPELTPTPNNMLAGKAVMFTFLKDIFPNLEVDYSIQIKSMDDHVKFEYITDFCEPTLKIDFEFLDMFWHNRDRYFDGSRNVKLEGEGWKIIEFKTTKISVTDLSNRLKKL